MMHGYLMLTDNIWLQDFPSIDVETTIEEINSLFEPYIFKRNTKRGVEYWTSCCRKHGFENNHRTLTPALIELITTPHNAHVACPFCGRNAQIKKTCYVKTGNKLGDYKPVLIVSEKNGDIYARGYWTNKEYIQKSDYCRPPLVHLASAYCFSAKKHMAVQFNRPEYNGDRDTSTYIDVIPASTRRISEPFWGNGYCSYHLIGREEISKSDLKYTQLEDKFPEKYICNFINYFTIAAVYPEKVEGL